MDEKLNITWRNVLTEMEKVLSKTSYETWLRTTRPLSLQNDVIIVEVPNDFTRDWLLNHYRKTLNTVMEKISDLKIHFVTPENVILSDNELSPRNYSLKKKLSYHSDNPQYKNDPLRVNKWLNPKYTFENFVIGCSNRLAHAASLAVAEAPSKAYNPLFIYGGVGLGKTHLMHAIGHFVITHNTSEKVVYLSSEKFTNEFINAIKDNKTIEFRNKYRFIDVLLIDDIQFLAGKEQTQEEFFHTFNALHESNRQIVISSDRPPKEIPTLEDRLRSRFEWGLITDIQPPDLETRIAILRKKSAQEGIFVPDDVLNFIAQKIETNIRELEGALIRVIAYASLEDKQINLRLAEESLKDFFSKERNNNLTIEKIINTTASYFKVNVYDLKSKKRSQNVALPRQIAMYLCRELTDHSLPRIGKEFGGKDHTTVIHAHKKIAAELQKDERLKRSIKEIKDLLFNY